MSLAGGALVAAETILAMTPIVIKKTPLDPLSAVWSRVLTAGLLGYAIAGEKTMTLAELPGSAALGYTNLMHIISSYESFRHLPAGQAMSLLYTYPLWILVLNHVFRGTKVTPMQYGLIGTAGVGAVLLNMEPGKSAPSPIVRRPDTTWGVGMGLLMALTEALMHVLLRGFGWKDPAKSVWIVNGWAGLWLSVIEGLYAVTTGDLPSGLTSGTWYDAALLTAFNAFTMFSGYWLRFFAVPRLSVVSYSMLSYAGLLASYLFGLFFLGERPGWMSLMGAVLIIVSGFFLQREGTSSD